ncbi:hypothetical protein A7U60_g7653 [Sanghuangporus baumii]|uniref:Uncharacterized protein n=1 Tax=Sanghuangporus baumii TaxID=108892 RepID=A0A9Q5HST7_SANBA|nr:hypothetical protein A7U60_g7653 [Sanghuangporus baumii]
MAYYIDSLLKKEYSGPKTSVVIGIDVGTTFSGVSYSVLHPGAKPLIYAVNKFSDQIAGDNKIPSIIYYDSSGAQQVIGPKTMTASTITRAVQNNWFKCEHFKLHLCPPDQEIETNGMHLGGLPPGKTREEVMGDFLRYLVNETRCHMIRSRTYSADVYDKTVKDEEMFIICHPNGWKGPSQQLYRDAAIRGGLVPDTEEGHKRIKFVTEGEASALACLWGRLDPENLTVGFRFMICDAGGGTVDTTTFEVVGTSPLELRECAIPSCRFAGSQFVSISGRMLLERILEGSKYVNGETIDTLISHEFERNVKMQFSGDDDAFLQLGYNLEDDEDRGIIAGSLSLRCEDVANCFEHSVSQIIESIDDQFSRSKSNKSATPIWLVGGFANNEYLSKELSRRLEQQEIRLEIPDTNLSKAVANGSVLHYIDNPVIARTCWTTYGTICYTQFDFSRSDHRERKDLVECERDGLFIGPLFDKLVEKGTSIPVGKKFVCTYHRTPLSRETARLKANILRYDGDLPAPYWYNENKDKFKTVLELEADLSSLWDSVEATEIRGSSLLELLFSSILPPHKDLVFEIELDLGGMEDKAAVKWKENGVDKYEKSQKGGSVGKYVRWIMLDSPVNEDLQPLKLGTKEYWDSIYEQEITNFEDFVDEGEIWFGQESVEKMVSWALSNVPPSPSSSSSASPSVSSSSPPPKILEVGSGNGNLLFALADVGYDPSYLAGVDYLPVDLKLEQGKLCGIPKVGGGEKEEGGEDGWTLVLDKGSYDAMALAERDEDGTRPSDSYSERVATLLTLVPLYEQLDK